MSLKLSIITVVLNNEATIEDCLLSVASQTYPDIEHIVVDGGSTDRTLDIIEKHRDKIAVFVSEKDHGMYDAINKGIRLASGDVIGILNSDDVYQDERIIEKVMHAFSENKCDSVYGDLVFVRPDLSRKVRYWKAGKFDESSFRLGWAPPHPAFFLMRKCYDDYGLYDDSFELAADYELILRMLMKRRISSAYLPETLVLMRTGGKSRITVRTNIIRTRETIRAWKANGCNVGFYTIFLKFIRSLVQFYIVFYPLVARNKEPVCFQAGRTKQETSI